MQDFKPNIDINHVVFNQFLKSIGMFQDVSKVQFQLDAPTRHWDANQVTIMVAFKLDLSKTQSTNMPIVPFIRDLQEKILESELVQDRVNMMKYNLEEASTTIRELQEKIKELSQVKSSAVPK